MGNSEWFNRRAIRLHLTLIVVFPGCLALGWWQLNVALSGNTLSWVYTFEWPGFAVYAVYMWWRLLHDATEQMDESTLMPVLSQVNDKKTGNPDFASDITGVALATNNAYDTNNTSRDANANTDRDALIGVAAFDPLAPGADTAGTANPDQAYGGTYEDMYEDEELAAYNRYLAELNDGTARIGR
ncbi:MAG: hypothetical protein M1399_00020 [Actinobacteria bacterium]|nr:hypothetical protein [Actinomycetota bacterium]MCL5446480.1 hypothetical protein [Actinomycetota bacterium]